MKRLLRFMNFRKGKGDYVWYLAYGSNLSVERFKHYITGGQPKGSTKNYEGCRDKTLFLKQKPYTINHDLYFAKNSSVWNNGGVAFISVERKQHYLTNARIYLVTKQQLEDIAKQETNSQENVQLDFDNAIKNGSTVFKSPSWYGKLISIGLEDGYPIFTITNEVTQVESSKPSKEYLETIGTGLKETYQLSNEEIASYLGSKRGVSRQYGPEELLEIIKSIE